MKRRSSSSWADLLVGVGLLTVCHFIPKKRTAKSEQKIAQLKQAMERSENYLTLHTNPALSLKLWGAVNHEVVCPHCPTGVSKKVRTKSIELGMLERFFTEKKTKTQATCTICLSTWFFKTYCNLAKSMESAR